MVSRKPPPPFQFPGAKYVGYFCDESTHTQFDQTYFSVGGLALPDRVYAPLLMRLEEIKDKWKPLKEIKWSTTPPGEHSAQTDFARCLSEFIKQGDAHLHIIFVNRHDFDNAKSLPGGTINDTVSKMFWQLLLWHPVTFYGPHCDIHVRPDKGEPTRNLEKYIASLEDRGKRQQRAKPKCITSLKPRESGEVLMLQLLDVTMGAFTAMKNRRLNNRHKTDLKKLVDDLYGNPDLAIDTHKHVQPFKLWNFRPDTPEPSEKALPALS